MNRHVPLDEVPLATILSRIEDELGACGRMLGGIEAAILAAVRSGHASSADQAGMKQIQNIDLLTQILGELAASLQVVAQSPAARAAGAVRFDDLAIRLGLADLRDRLAGQAAPELQRGGVDLF